VRDRLGHVGGLAGAVFDRAVGLFQVQAEGLRTDFPPLRALDASPGNLRPAATSLIGRESEVAEVQAAVKAHRLVTLTGVGGVGKTRLATEVAARLADEFPDGVWFFDLAAVTDPAAVPDAVAAVLGITQQPGKSVANSVAAALEGRVRLLVFDNCEHVVDSVADLVEAILAASATVTILATSREGLGVSEERLWRIPSLDVSSGTESAAVHLFVDRAQSVVSDFSMGSSDEADAVVEICRRLDGIPLAIELAASRMASMTASEVRDRLDQRFRLLVGSRRGLSRHQTLRHAVAWSYDHLDDAERALLERYSVFAGGFDLQSACAVAGFGDPDDYAILDLLDALVRKSLLLADRSAVDFRRQRPEIHHYAPSRHPAAGGCAITVSRTPYRGWTPKARATVGAGIPGTPGIPDPAASSVPASVVKPAGDKAETARVDGADQLAGTDNGPIEFARATLASTALGRPAPPPRPDAAPAGCCSAGSAGVTSAATFDKSGRRPKFFWPPMIPSAVPSKSRTALNVEYVPAMISKKPNSGLNVGSSGGSAWAAEEITGETGSAVAALASAWPTAAL
jgi:predicted ATPase